MDKKKPVSIILIGLLFLVMFFPGLIMLLAALLSTSYAKGIKEQLLDIVMRVLYLIVPIGCLYSGAALLKFKESGRYCALIIAPILILGFLWVGLINLSHIFFRNLCFLFAILFMLISLYLTRPKVKEQFQ